METRDFYNSFIQLEKKHPELINEYKDENEVYLWPVVKQAFFSDFHISGIRYVERNLFPQEINYSRYTLPAPLIKGLSRLPKGGCLLIDSPNYYTLQTAEGSYDPYLDPLIPELKAVGLKPLKFINGAFKKPTQTVNPCIQLPMEARKGSSFDWNTFSKETGYELYAEASLRQNIPVLSPQRIAKNYCQIIAFTELFKELLTMMAPKLVIQVCYYVPQMMGLTLACNMLNIPCVDYQHGLHTSPHPGYNFGHIPADGFQMVPQHFFTWGDEPRDALSKTFSKQNFHSAHAAGKPSFLARKTGTLKAGIGAERLSEKIEGKTPIVVIFPLITSQEALMALREAITNSPADWIWLFRAHPLFPSEEFKWLKEHCLSRIEHESTSQVSIDELLAIAKHVVTVSSTTVYEAVYLYDLSCTSIGNPTDPYVATLASRGLMAVANDAQSILRSIKQGISGQINKPDGPAYINKNLDQFRKALAEIDHG